MDCVVWTMSTRGSINIVKNLVKKGVNFHQIKIKKDGFNKEHIKTLLEYSMDGFDSLISKRTQAYAQIQDRFEHLKTQEVIDLISNNPEILKFPILFDGHDVYYGNQIAEYIDDISHKLKEQTCSLKSKYKFIKREKKND